ncbi:hypothetical protein [Rhodococcus sp. PSBB049]|uniref:hypothetical protein n=1 Tax=Rhodococcus sp. PSBB049 TaxID=2812863 RepID=UPI001981095E|nr:hypothetical protein [Rhodococcus sp. PSBB049]QSE72339.1 hypothetical protein JYA91_28730 [Rhodococcus sp. PSBB049]
MARRRRPLPILGDPVADSPGRIHTVARLHGAHAAFEQHGLPLVLPPHLHHMVGVGLTTYNKRSNRAYL